MDSQETVLSLAIARRFSQREGESWPSYTRRILVIKLVAGGMLTAAIAGTVIRLSP